MSETESLLLELQAALKALDKATTERNTALAQWAELKTKAATSPWAAGQLAAARQTVQACDLKFSECHAAVRRLDGRLGQAQARRVFEGAMYKPNTLTSTRSQPL